MIISVDHGNKSIKTPNTLFTSGLISSEGLQGFKTDYICWNGRYYTLTEQRISYLRDKTEDERFYVLTLFAIAKELERRKAAETLDPIDITLLIGLPPAHYEQLHSRFEQYFLRRREAIDFEYNGKYYSIRISKVLSYPQAFAAAVTQYTVRSRPILLPTSSTLAALPLTFSSCVTDVLTWRWSKVLKRGSSPSTTALRASAMRSMPGS